MFYCEGCFIFYRAIKPAYGFLSARPYFRDNDILGQSGVRKYYIRDGFARRVTSSRAYYVPVSEYHSSTLWGHSILLRPPLFSRRVQIDDADASDAA